MCVCAPPASPEVGGTLMKAIRSLVSTTNRFSMWGCQARWRVARSPTSKLWDTSTSSCASAHIKACQYHQQVLHVGVPSELAHFQVPHIKAVGHQYHQSSKSVHIEAVRHQHLPLWGPT
eukprot:1161743-Pelagomonas_calceolata.AAC.4